jgi:hypothetical protein
MFAIKAEVHHLRFDICIGYRTGHDYIHLAHYPNILNHDILAGPQSLHLARKLRF